MKNHGDLYIKEGLRNVIAPDGEFSVTFSVIVCGSKCINYEWFRNDVLIPGETHNVLRIYNINKNLSGKYTVKAYNKKSCVKSCANLSVRVMIPKVFISMDANEVLVYDGNELELLNTIETAGIPFGIAFSKDSAIITNTTGNMVTKANGDNPEISEQFDIGGPSKFASILEVGGKEMVAITDGVSAEILVMTIDLAPITEIVNLGSPVTGMDAIDNKLLITNENSSDMSYITLDEIGDEIVSTVEEISTAFTDLFNPSFSTGALAFVQGDANTTVQVKPVEGDTGVTKTSPASSIFSVFDQSAQNIQNTTVLLIENTSEVVVEAQKLDENLDVILESTNFIDVTSDIISDNTIIITNADFNSYIVSNNQLIKIPPEPGSEPVLEKFTKITVKETVKPASVNATSNFVVLFTIFDFSIL